MFSPFTADTAPDRDRSEELARTERFGPRVTFRPLMALELDAYLASGEWQGRAGAYAIQGLGGRLVRSIEGDYLNVVGLPAALLVTLLERHAPNILQMDS